MKEKTIFRLGIVLVIILFLSLALLIIIHFKTEECEFVKLDKLIDIELGDNEYLFFYKSGYVTTEYEVTEEDKIGNYYQFHRCKSSIFPEWDLIRGK